MQLSRELVSVSSLIEDVRQTVRPLADKQGVSVSFQVAEDLPEIFVDPIRLRQILFNLISNGIKFNHRHGSVQLAVHAEADRVLWVISDTGVGIRDEDLSRLFREFERIEHQGPKPEGTGLGLALTKRLVELHGGTIDVESRAGKGSTFTVSIPQQAS
jgi:signal transduction histidine kinase